VRIERLMFKPKLIEGGKEEALAAGKRRFPNDEVKLHAYHDGEWWIAVRHPGDPFWRVVRAYE